MGQTTITIQLASLIVGLVLPLLVGFITKMTTHPSTKAILLLFFSACSSFLTEYLNERAAFQWKIALITWGGTFIVGVGMHFGLYKPTGAAAAAQKIGVK